MSKTDALYKEILLKKVVRFDDIVDLAEKTLERNFDRSYISNVYVHNLLRSNRLKRIRRGLYAAIPPTESDPIVDKLLIASKIRENYYLGFHTALEYLGCAYSAHNEAYTCVKPERRFTAFAFRSHTFKPVFTSDLETEIEEKEYRGHTIRISSKERTFVECLDRVDYAGGWEEDLKSLENLGGLDFQKIRDLLIQTNKQVLVRKTGFVLELLKERSIFYEHLSKSTLEEIEKEVHGAPTYLIRNMRGPLNTHWRLYIPEGFEEKLRGV